MGEGRPYRGMGESRAEEGEFEKNQGRIISRGEEGAPERWLCGKNSNGEPIHPSDAKKPVAYLASVQELEDLGHNPQQGEVWLGTECSKEVKDEMAWWDGPLEIKD
jgi:hypothetical protein